MILMAGKSCRGLDNKIAMEYKNCTCYINEPPNGCMAVIPLMRTHNLDHLAPGIEIHNHDRLDLISEGQVSKHPGASK